ncbi:hypothetical protein K4H03_31045, partial [Mycobacterium tuberculosis]|nr:hypothetical protein [Mycobacterium tuberculosis]
MVAGMLLWPAGLMIGLGAGLGVAAWGKIGVLPFLGLVVAAGVALASLIPLTKRNLRCTPLFTYGMVLAHLG